MSLKKYEGLISRMCKELAQLYIAKEDARAVAGRANLDIREIPFSDRSMDTWRSVIIYAIENQQLLSLVEICLKEYPSSPTLVEAINLFYEKEMDNPSPSVVQSSSDKENLRQLLSALENSMTGFRAQVQNRNQLYERIKNRLKITETLPYEEFFVAYFEEMNQFEKRLHKIIRHHTSYIRENNLIAKRISDSLPHLDKEIPLLKRLRQHLDFWLYKFDHLFATDPAMCLIYAGAGDKIPFPRGVEEQIMRYLERI